MMGDFSRVTFDPRRQYTRVLMQQGRVQVDADWNEQMAIFWHYWRTLARDLIGAHGGPIANAGFGIVTDGSDFKIGPGRYYVGGLLCDNWREDMTYYSQAENYPLDENSDALPDLPYLVYLDVWERHITYIEDGNIREVALGGPDTTTRSQIVWQAKTWQLDDGRLEELRDELEQDIRLETLCDLLNDNWETVSDLWWPEATGRLQARTEAQARSTDPCITAPESRYRGVENQLYRVEIHRGGTADRAIYKWSRDNGAVIFPIYTGNGKTVALESMGRDNYHTLSEGSIVEVVDHLSALHGDREPEPLLKVTRVTAEDLALELGPLNGNGAQPSLPGYGRDDERRPFLRRWEGYGAVRDDEWLTLEDGVQIQFQPRQTGETEARVYRRGDYWLIPARVASGDVQWPRKNGAAVALAPHGVRHYYAPLAIIGAGDDGEATVRSDCRRLFDTLV